MTDKQLIIKGNPSEVKAIVNNLMRRFGNITLQEVVDKYGKNRLVFV